jgi:hypothetical protein
MTEVELNLSILDGAHSDNSVALALAYMALNKVNLPAARISASVDKRP